MSQTMAQQSIRTDEQTQKIGFQKKHNYLILSACFKVSDEKAVHKKVPQYCSELCRSTRSVAKASPLNDHIPGTSARDEGAHVIHLEPNTGNK